MLAQFAVAIADLSFNEPTIPMVAVGVASPEYWVRHVRDAVRFADDVDALIAEGVSTFVELGPAGVLSGIGAGTWVATVRPERGGEVVSLVEGVATAWTRGVDVDWAAYYGGGNPVDLPTYPFQRQRYWLDDDPYAGDVAALGLTASEHPLLRAEGTIADSGAALLTGTLSRHSHPWLADHAVMGTVLVPGTAFLELALHAGHQLGVPVVDELTLQAPLSLPDNGSVAVQVTVNTPIDSGQRQFSVHCRVLEAADWTLHATGWLTDRETAADIADLAAWPPAGATPVAVDYRRLAGFGYGYGPVFQGLRRGWQRDKDIYAEVTLPDGATPETFGLHPALLDSALHAVIMATLADEGAEPTAKLPFSWTGVQLTAVGASSLRVRLTRGGDGTVSVTAVDPAGQLVLTAESLVSREVSAHQLSVADTSSLYRTEWVPLAVGDAENPDMTLLRVRTPEGDVPSAVREVCASVLDSIRDFLAQGTDGLLVVVTENALAGNVVQAPVWGLVRSAQTENPDRILLVDADDPDVEIDAAVAAAVATGESQLVIHGGEAKVARLAEVDTDLLCTPDGAPWRLDVTEPGALDNLVLAATPEMPLADGQIRVEMRSAGINFRDVLMALGMYPGEPKLGGEGAGVVVEVGPDVTGLAVGDRVMGLFTHAFAAQSVTDQRTVVKIPTGWTFDQAAAIPMVFLTALYGLNDLTGLKAGEKVLIHAAAGGVGMAAVQLAQHFGAEVYATASPSKWDALRAMGIGDDHIASSRTLDFKDKFGQVDVVLNSLTSEFIDASVALLGPDGRFLEMGLADIRDADSLGVRYQAFQLAEAGLDRVRSMLVELVGLFGDGTLAPPPLRSWDVRRAREAFRFISQARHIGKVVLRMPRTIGPQGTVLVTGASGRLGGLAAKHLAQQGIATLVLVSRSAVPHQLVTELEAAGTKVVTATCDVTDRAALRAVLAEHELTGVVHAAGLLDDGPVDSLTAQRINDVIAPKVDGAWHLHELTADADLAFFVLYSSAAGILGSAGQGGYNAGNTFLDALAELRVGQGLPATALAWGPWDSVGGMTDGLGTADLARMRRSGAVPLTTAEGLALFDAAIGRDEPVLAPIRIDAAKLTPDASAVLRGLVRVQRVRSTGRPAAGATSIVDRVAGLPLAEAEHLLLEFVRDQVALVLGHASSQHVPSGEAFRDLGFDSLTAVELRNRLKTITGLTLPATLVFDHPTPRALAALLVTHLVPKRSDQVLAELDRLADMLTGPVGDQTAERRITERLRALLDARTGTQKAAEGTGFADALRSASADDVLKLIDTRLGRRGRS
ncbi:SDR family NAD(P)-dependent oxidoreductase [Streptomyces sp. 8L]|uniref:SDR family NAD(P)-dependent oxidoreductase n=1 Tax=Streptomyces sp. 8L TaxID=2877242 RepID=UPI001CD3079E|nr:SDR family NAD(P)-dependent oxidoreductase [Streptomyces sp. 8L]MCA1217799.1 SDR family NAD(P)-dependent oxidoreductase [Streptomyces sp. 8L]